MVAAIRDGRSYRWVWGDGGEPEVVIMSTSRYRQLCGDDDEIPRAARRSSG
jgi:hypothetical protein